MSQDDDLYSELDFYTLAHRDPAFIHQVAVDAYTAQSANEATKPIALVFALVGLYLYLEKGYTGKQVQQAHMRLANKTKHWPRLPIPAERGEIRIEHVVNAPPGPDRDALIHRWCASVWRSWHESHLVIAAISHEYLGTD